MNSKVYDSAMNDNSREWVVMTEGRKGSDLFYRSIVDDEGRQAWQLVNCLRHATRLTFDEADRVSNMVADINGAAQIYLV